MFIYKITNTINNKIYVGLTRHTLKKRFNEHKYAAKCGQKQTALYSAFNKHGVDNFKIEELEKCKNIEILNKKEQYWILKLNTLSPNGYNLSTGGDSFVLSNESKEKLRISTKKRSKSSFNLVGLELGRKKKKVIRLNVKTNEIKIYDTIKSVELDGFNPKRLSDVIHRRTGNYKGFYWRLEDKIPRKAKLGSVKSVVMYDLNGNFIKEYESAVSAKIDGYHKVGISMCCTGKIKQYKKRIFRFKPPGEFANLPVTPDQMIPR